MDLGSICAATPAGGDKRRSNKKKRSWRRRLLLRKTAVQPPAMQSRDKRGPKKTEEGDWEQTNDSGNILRFACSQCKDGVEYAPRDLARHFEESHPGRAPVFPCQTCTFSTQEFSYLKVHLLSHKDTFSSCTMCNDSIQRLWPEFEAHLTMQHSLNGKYFCEVCKAFSSGDVQVFLEHIYGHNMDLGEADVLLRRKSDKNHRLSAQTFVCQYCGFEASQQFLIARHVKAVHVCQNGSQWQEERGVCSIVAKPHDTIPRTKPRITRSAAKETCWLTEDCLSLPGKEFLDKYCHLSDPKTTLEETEQFLMRSVSAGETDDQKWTKALKTVLSNHPKSENGILLDSSDLAVLTVKNKITLAQNGASFPKRLKMMTPTSEESCAAAGNASQSGHSTTKNGWQSSLKDQIFCPEAVSGAQFNSVVLPLNESAECIPMHTNGDQSESTSALKVEQLSKKPEQHGKETESLGNLKLATENDRKTTSQKARRRRQNRRRKRKKLRKRDRRSDGSSIKMILKKNLVKETQWLSDNSLPAIKDEMYGCGMLKGGQSIVVEKPQVVQPTELCQTNGTVGSTSHHHETPEATTPDLLLKSGDKFNSCLAASTESHDEPTVEPPPHSQSQNDGESTPILSEIDFNKSGAASERNRDVSSVTKKSDEQLQQSLDGANCHESGDRKQTATSGVNVNSSCDSLSPAPRAADALQDTTAVDVSPLEISTKHRVECAGGPADVNSSVLCPADKATQKDSAAASGHPWLPVSKQQERTLKLVAFNPSQPIKHPTGDQPVVVLNHPDADIPQVVKIMDIVNRYKEVEKVVLSRRTVEALSVNVPVGPTRMGENSVKTRFTLKFKLRRLSRKKYEIVGVDSPSRDSLLKFPCWFCGRVFPCQETMMSHRQRHLMEWKRPNCENP